MTLEELTAQWQSGQITLMSLAHKLKLVATQLHELYPAQGPLMSKFRAHVYGGTCTDSWCDHSHKFRTLITLEQGFRPFCGNQSTCLCNQQHQAQLKQMRTPERKKLIQERRTSTSLQKYGVPVPSQHESVKAKALHTCMHKYGAPAPTCNPQVLDKMRATNQQNWGVDFVQQNPDVRARTQQVFESEYGGTCPSQNPQVKLKIKQTNLDKYGVEAPFLQDVHRDTNRLTLRSQSYDSQVSSLKAFEPMFTRDHYVQGSPHDEYEFLCKSCGSKFLSLVKAQVEIRCYECHPKRETWGEVAIKQWLHTRMINYQQWDRQQIKPWELDFWLPDHKVAIEFNGIWYHRHDKLQDRKYHQNKFKLCEAQGIRLIQIWEHELHAKPDIIWYRLAHVLGHSTQHVGARKCEIIPLSHQQSREFINAHHLQGHVPTPHVWGLQHDGRLLAVASFVKNRYNSLADWELARYCILPGINLQGGLSKLIRHAQQQLAFGSLLSYSNLNWGKGSGYEKVGFELSHISVPNYWYFKNIHDVQSRLRFQKHKIVGKAPGNTEKEIAQNMGYSRFYDAGSAVWIRKF